MLYHPCEQLPQRLDGSREIAFGMLSFQGDRSPHTLSGNQTLSSPLGEWANLR